MSPTMPTLARYTSGSGEGEGEGEGEKVGEGEGVISGSAGSATPTAQPAMKSSGSMRNISLFIS